MSRRQQQASLVQEAREKVIFTPPKDVNESSVSDDSKRSPTVPSPLMSVALLGTAAALPLTVPPSSSPPTSRSLDAAGGAAMSEPSQGAAQAAAPPPNRVSARRGSPLLPPAIPPAVVVPLGSLESCHTSAPQSRCASAGGRGGGEGKTASPPAVDPSAGGEYPASALPLEWAGSGNSVTSAHDDGASASATTVAALRSERARLLVSLDEERRRRSELERLVRELSETVHQQARQIEAERTSSRQLREELLQLRAKVESGTSCASRPVVGSRSGCAGTVPNLRIPSPDRGVPRPANVEVRRSGSLTEIAEQRSASAGADSSRRIPSVMRPTLSSGRRSPLSSAALSLSRLNSSDRHLLEGRASPLASRGPSATPPASRPVTPPHSRGLSPSGLRQRLATASFLKPTTSTQQKNVASSSNAASSTGGGPARPRLTQPQHSVAAAPTSAATASSASSGSTAYAGVRRTTTVITRQGVVVSSAQRVDTVVPRKVTPVRQRLEAAMARVTTSGGTSTTSAVSQQRPAY